MKNLRTATLLILGLPMLAAAAEPTTARLGLTRAGATAVVAAAIAEARRLGAPGAAVAVVDDGGNLIALDRLDNTFAAGASIAAGKARSAALFRKPTRMLEATINEGRTAMTALPDFVPLQGGVPIEIDGAVLGAVGVSGAASAAQDDAIAAVAAASLGHPAAAKNSAFSADDELPAGPAAVAVDLTTSSGADAFNATWRYSDTRIVEVDFRAPGPDGQPGGHPVRTYDFTPHAGGIDFDDSGWEVVRPEELSRRRSNGRLSFNWYRLHLTVPDTVDGVATAGATLVFETSLDDYAEVWVDGELTRAPAQTGGSVIGGWNAVNRLVVGRNVRPGQKIAIAVFGINGPISDPVPNYIWMRSAKLALYAGSREPIALAPREVNVEVVRLDPAIDAIVPANPKIYKLAEGFEFTEGPVWVDDGYLLFSDPNANRIYRYSDAGGLSVLAEHSGYSGADVGEYAQPGSNGLALDASGRLTVNEHGNRRITRRDGNGVIEVIADRFDGKRFNSPNDLTYRSDGSLYFTDPPFGLPKVFDDPRKELPYSGVYRWVGGDVQLLTRDLSAPNGLAFSPDETFLYVDNWDLRKKVVMRYAVAADGSLRDGRVFFDMTDAPGEEALDGLKVDRRGNLYISGPGGIWIVSASGRHLGTIRAPRLPANFAWGDDDGRTLYMTARNSLYRMRLNIAGARTAFRSSPMNSAKR